MNSNSLLFLKIALLVFILFTASNLAAQTSEISDSQYHSPKETVKSLSEMNDENSSITKIYSLAESPDKNSVSMIEIGSEVNSSKKTLPAVLVVANMDGDVPISTEAALYLAHLIIQKPETRKNLTWYILPNGNPDAAVRFFSKLVYHDTGNGKSINDDKDENIDEDGYDDLNKDGFITKMRVKDPAGNWLPINKDSQLMKKADASKGEKGIYKLYSEGIDNDNDGKYNEDGKGGVDVGINFPQLFKSFTVKGGIWPGSEAESYNLMRFVSNHPEIAMTVTFGSTNWCMIPPKGGRRGSVDFSKIKIPKRIAKRFNFDDSRTYTMKEIMELVKSFVPQGMEVTESMIASFFGLGAVVNPLDEDLKYYKELSEKYKDYLKENKFDKKRFDPANAKNGSFELWSYFQLGVPTFSMDFWTLPKLNEKKAENKSDLTVEKIGEMSSDEFTALGKEKITAFLKENGAPPQYKAAMVINMVKSGRITPEKISKMIKKMSKSKNDKNAGDKKTKALIEFSNKYLGGKGFVNWEKFKHPTLGNVEIGGAVPFAENTPPASMIDSLLKVQVPWIIKLTSKLPQMKILKTESKPLGADIYEVNIWIENSGYLPFPTAMGKRNENVPPAILTIKGSGIEFLSGKKRTPVKSLAGLSSKKIKFLIKGKSNTKLAVKFVSKNAWADSTIIKLGGSK